MTDAETIKALEVCVGIHNDCESCPLLEYSRATDECMTEVMNNALDLINRQKAEIERLKENKMLIANIEVTEDVLKKLINQKVISITNDKADVSFLCDKQIRAEAIKEFAERLHCHCLSIINEEWNKKVYPTSWADAYEEFDDVVDNLVKEMAGDTE